jgi:hypothetical protein
MTDRALSDLVADWGGFERLVAQLHETGGVSVEHNVTLPGRSGAPRQIDVLVRHTEGLYEHLIVVECKYRNSPVERIHVDALATTIREVGAARGVIFSTQGFQSGAISQARHDNISLFLLREPTDVEWGLPGRHVDVWLQIISASIGNLKMPMAHPVGFTQGAPLNIDIRLGDPGRTSTTRIKAEGKPEVTLEALLTRMAMQTSKTVYKPVRANFDGAFNGDIRHVIRVNFEPHTPTLLFIDRALLIAPRITFDLGVKVTQSRFQVDRAAPYAFVLAVENCISKVTTTASRLLGNEHTELTPPSEHSQSDEAIFENGSMISVWVSELQPFSEFEGLEPSTGPEVKMTL